MQNTTSKTVLIMYTVEIDLGAYGIEELLKWDLEKSDEQNIKVVSSCTQVYFAV